MPKFVRYNKGDHAIDTADHNAKSEALEALLLGAGPNVDLRSRKTNQRVVLYRILDDIEGLGGGRYWVKLYEEDRTAAIDVADDLTEAEFGPAIYPKSAQLWNPAELGTDAHGLPRGEDAIPAVGYVMDVLRTGELLIIPTGGLGIPPGTGKYKVLSILDDEDPGTVGWEFPRFHE